MIGFKQLRGMTERAMAGLASLICIAGPLLVGNGACASEPAKEYKIKAAYLFNCLKFIEWPTNAFSSELSPITVGVMDRGDALPVLQKALEGRTAGNHPIRVQALKR